MEAEAPNSPGSGTLLRGVNGTVPRGSTGNVHRRTFRRFVFLSFPPNLPVNSYLALWPSTLPSLALHSAKTMRSRAQSRAKPFSRTSLLLFFFFYFIVRVIRFLLLRDTVIGEARAIFRYNHDVLTLRIPFGYELALCTIDRNRKYARNSDDSRDRRRGQISTDMVRCM